MRLIICILVFSFPAYAGNRNLKIHTTDSAAMGYADVALSGPAAGALDQPGNSFKAISIDARGTLSEGLRIVDWIDDVRTFRDSFSINPLGSIDDLKKIVESSGWTLGSQVRLDLLRFSFFGTKLGYLSVGVYVESSVGVRVAKPDVDKIVWRGDHIDIGKTYRMLEAKGLADGGMALEYGRAVELPKKMRLGAGIRHRFFHRVDFPNHAALFHRNLYDESDIELPDISYHRGWGFGTDLFLSFDVGDKYVGGRFSVEANNVPMTAVWMDNSNIRDMALIGMGFALHPLRWVGYDGLVSAFDVEVFEDDVAAAHLGFAWRLGNQRFHFTPSIGWAIPGRDVWGDAYNAFTCGFSAKVAVLELASVFEYRGEGRFDAGMRVAVGW
jgi:hypothetical protein